MGCRNTKPKAIEPESVFTKKKNKMVNQILYKKRGSCIISLDLLRASDHMVSLRKCKVDKEYTFNQALGEGAYGCV